MYPKVRSKGNAADEEEQGVERVHDQGQDWHDDESLVDSRRNEVDEGDH